MDNPSGLLFMVDQVIKNVEDVQNEGGVTAVQEDLKKLAIVVKRILLEVTSK